MPPLPSTVLVGVALGGLAAVGPTGLVSALSLLVERLTGRRARAWITVPAVVVLTVPVGLLLGLIDPAGLRPVQILVGLSTAGLIGLGATSQVSTLADRWPRSAGSTRREPGLSASVADAVDAAGQVTITPSGPIESIDTFREVPEPLRESIADATWRLPADLPLPALEARIEDRLETEYDLHDATVDVDRQGRASIAVAPPERPVGRSVREGARAITVLARAPPSIATGERVALYLEEASGADGAAAGDPIAGRVIDAGSPAPAAAPSATAAWRSITVEVDSTDAGPVLAADRVRVGVPARPEDDDVAAMALLDRAGRTLRRATLDETAIERIDESASCHVLAVRESRAGGRWQFDADPAPGNDAFVIGDPVVVAEVSGEGSA